jgi:hypothetical protein
MSYKETIVVCSESLHVKEMHCAQNIRIFLVITSTKYHTQENTHNLLRRVRHCKSFLIRKDVVLQKRLTQHRTPNHMTDHKPPRDRETRSSGSAGLPNLRGPETSQYCQFACCRILQYDMLANADIKWFHIKSYQIYIHLIFCVMNTPLPNRMVRHSQNLLIQTRLSVLLRPIQGTRPALQDLAHLNAVSV